jgi:O-antigen/teichoic acid export membrane protein
MGATEDGAQLPGPRFSRQRVLNHLTLLAMRGFGTAAKFFLAIYTARYLGLADLGIYGLLAAASTLVPAILGFGMTDWLNRKLVDLPRAEALPLIASRLGLTLSIHLVLQPLAFAADILLGEPIPLRIAALGGAILLLESLGVEAADMLIARRHIFLAYWLTFLRTGAWPVPVIAIGLLYPEARGLEFLLVGWFVSLVVSWLILLPMILPEGRWRHMRPRWRLQLGALRGGMLFYVKDVSSAISTYLDRFIISMMLGLELTGVYTLFWSIANVAHSLTVYGVLQAQLPQLIATAQTGDQASFRALERHLQIETVAWALLLALGAAIATPLILPFLGQPLVQAYLPIFWLILFATLLRIAADAYGFVLLAQHRDRATAIIAVTGSIASSGLNLILISLAGLWGAAGAYAITSGGLFAARYMLSRPAKWLGPPGSDSAGQAGGRQAASRVR